MDQITQTIPDFFQLSGVDKVLAVGWLLHHQGGKDLFSAADLREAFRLAHAECPPLNVYLPRLADKRPAQIVREKGCFRLQRDLRRELTAKYGSTPSTVAVTALLTSLVERFSNVNEQRFLHETFDCYRVSAFRATIVMAWNLAYDHLRGWICSSPDRLARANDAIAVRYPKKTERISSVVDFEEFKEGEIIEILRTARLLPKNTIDMLKEKLGRRNGAAHPSSLIVTQAQADDAITDLVHNVVLALN